MEELKKFVQLLWRYRLIMITVPLITIMITYFIVHKMPFVYGAPTQIATGIVDENQQMSFADVGMLQESRINQKFTNLIETMRSKSLIDQVSYRLILHDLTSPVPFKDLNILYKNGLTKEAIKHAIEVYTEKYKKREGLNLRDPDQAGLATVLGWMRYDAGSILDRLTIFRLGNTDFIYADIESESPELSAFAVNALVEEFIADYTNLVKENQRASVDFLSKLIKAKADILTERVNALREYRIKNRILNLNEQSTQLLTEAGNYETQLQESEKETASLKGAMDNIDRQFDPKDRKYVEAAIAAVSQDILVNREEMHSLLDKFQESDFDEKYKTSIDSLQRIMNLKIATLNDRNVLNPLNTRDALIQQKLALQIRYDIASYSQGPIKKHIEELNKKFTSLVPHEAAIQTFDRDILIVSKEYQDLLAQYNQINMEAGFPVKLRQTQIAMPGAAKPSKKMLLVILSGIASGAFCLLAFFVIFFFDDKIRTPSELVHTTKIPVLGYLNLVGKSALDLKGIWKNLHGTPEMMEFKRQLRSTRFEVNKELTHTSNSGSMLSITSLSEGEGKTLLSACIAYTYVMVNKKVLLIDGNFDNPSITVNSNTKLYIEDFLKTGDIDRADFNSGIMVMGNLGGDNSLLEACDEKIIRERFAQLKSKFDIILIETPSLDSLNKAKEWISFTDKTVCVFEANQSLNEIKKQHIHYLSSINGHFIGWILNKVRPEGRMPERVSSATIID